MMKTKNKVLLSCIMSAICAASVAIAGVQLFTKDNATATKGVYEPNFTLFADAGATQTDTISSAWLFSEGNDYMLFTTAFKVGEGKTYSEIGYTVTVDGTSTDYPSADGGKTYYTGIRITTADDVVEQTTQDIFGEIDATGMIVDEFEYDPSKAYVVTPYMQVEGGEKETGKAIAVSENTYVEEHEHTFMNEYGFTSSYETWATCTVCGIQSYASEALTVNSEGTIHNSSSVSASRDCYAYTGADTTNASLANAANYTKTGHKVTDSSVSYNLGQGRAQDFVYTVTAEKAGAAKIFVNVRSTNMNAQKINAAAQLNYTLKLFVNDVEVPIPDDVVTCAYLEGCYVWAEYELNVAQLNAGENTVKLDFFKADDSLGTFDKKPYGVYFSYMRVETVGETSCATGNHHLSFVKEVANNCVTDGVQAHYVCQDCGLLFTEDKVPTNKKSLIIPCDNLHAYDLPRYVDESTHAATCVRCGDVKTEAHNHTDGGAYLIVAKNPNKVWYYAGQTLDTDRMEVYTSTVCADGCKNSASIEPSALTYTYQNGEAFTAGDTYVSISYTDGGVTYTGKVEVKVVATADDILTVDNGTANVTLQDKSSGSQNLSDRTTDTGGTGQSGYGGSYISSVGVGDVVTFSFNLDEAKKGNVVLQASSNAAVKGTGADGFPEYCRAVSVNSVMTITVNGKVAELSDAVLLKGSVSNLEAASNRWVWTNWDQLDLGSFDLVSGTNTVEITFKNELNVKDTYGNPACGQLDCLNVFFE